MCGTNRDAWLSTNMTDKLLSKADGSGVNDGGADLGTVSKASLGDEKTPQ
eukprot:COSAG05_NODE_3143_length_2289_cov_2.110502_3_plen_50_part_00